MVSLCRLFLLQTTKRCLIRPFTGTRNCLPIRYKPQICRYKLGRGSGAGERLGEPRPTSNASPFGSKPTIDNISLCSNKNFYQTINLLHFNCTEHDTGRNWKHKRIKNRRCDVPFFNYVLFLIGGGRTGRTGISSFHKFNFDSLIVERTEI